MKLRARGKAVRCSYCHGEVAGDLCDCGGTHADCVKLNGSCPACGEGGARPRGLPTQLEAGLARLSDRAVREASWGLDLAEQVLQHVDEQESRAVAPFQCGWEAHTREIAPGACGRDIGYLGWCSEACWNRSRPLTEKRWAPWALIGAAALLMALLFLVAAVGGAS